MSKPRGRRPGTPGTIAGIPRLDLGKEKILSIWFGQENEWLSKGEVVDIAVQKGIPSRTAYTHIVELISDGKLESKTFAGKREKLKPTYSFSTFNTSTAMALIDRSQSTLTIPLSIDTWITIHNFPEIGTFGAIYKEQFQKSLNCFSEEINKLENIRLDVIMSNQGKTPSNLLENDKTEYLKVSNQPLSLTITKLPTSLNPPSPHGDYANINPLNYIISKFEYEIAILTRTLRGNGWTEEQISCELKKKNLHDLDNLGLKTLRKLHVSQCQKRMVLTKRNITALDNLQTDIATFTLGKDWWPSCWKKFGAVLYSNKKDLFHLTKLTDSDQNLTLKPFSLLIYDMDVSKESNYDQFLIYYAKIIGSIIDEDYYDRNYLNESIEVLRTNLEIYMKILELYEEGYEILNKKQLTMISIITRFTTVGYEQRDIDSLIAKSLS